MGDSYKPIKKWINKTKKRHMRKLRTLKHSKLIETEISAFQYLKNKY